MNLLVNIHINVFFKAHDLTLKGLEKINYKESDYAVEIPAKLNLAASLL